MPHQIIKIYNAEKFERLTKGIKIAQNFGMKSTVSEEPEHVNNLEDNLIISKSLCCSFCNTDFGDKNEQRLHYKLDWHRFNLKQHLQGFDPVSEANFNSMTKMIHDQNISDTDTDSESVHDKCLKSSSIFNKHVKSNSKLQKVHEYYNLNLKEGEVCGESYDGCIKNGVKNMKLNLQDSLRQKSKVYFENEDGLVFSIYKCLLHNKKDISDIDFVPQVLECGKRCLWTVIIIGGGHFAAAVFSDGHPLVHKSFHSYIVRAKQGFTQCNHDSHSSNHFKSAGSSVRRYNMCNFIKHVQQILNSWSTYISSSSLILYRAVGPCNRNILFGGRNPPLDKSDRRLRVLSLSTRKATFSEVKRVYDTISNLEVYGTECKASNCCALYSKQIFEEKTLNLSLSGINTNRIAGNRNVSVLKSNSLLNNHTSTALRAQSKNSRIRIDRAKPRRSPHRPLPAIVAKFAHSSSESDYDIQDVTGKVGKINFVETNCDIYLKDRLQFFESK